MSPKSNLTRVLLGTAMGGFLMASTALADVPKPTVPVQGNSPEVRKLLADAQTAMKGGNYRLAMINLKNAIQIAPSNNEAHVQLGIVLFQTGDRVGAEREIRQARKGGMADATILPFLFKVMLARQEYQELVDQFPDPGTSASPLTTNLLKARAFALQRLGRGPEATDAADRALKLEPDGQGFLARASLALQQGDLAAARKFADEAVKKDPASKEIALFKLGVLKTAKDNAGAQAFGDQLLVKFPGNPDVQYAHVELMLDQKQFAKAKAEIDALVAKNSASILPVYYKALLASRMGNAKAAWDIAVALPKEFVEVSPTMGMKVAQMAVDAGRPQAAADVLGRVLGSNTDDILVRRRLAALYLEQNNAKSALTLLAPVEGASDPETVRLLSRIYTVLKRKDDAQAVLKRLGPTRDHALLDIRDGRTEQAIAELKEVTAKEPGNAQAAQTLINTLIEARRFPEALAIADRLGQDSRQRATALVYRGNILMAQHSLPEAQSAFDKAVGLEPKNPAVQLARADFFMATQKYADASKDLQAVLSVEPKNIAARVKLASIAARQGRDQDTRKMLDEAIALAPQDPAPRLALISQLMARKDFKAALSAADDLIRRQPSNTEALTMRGQLQLLLGQKPQAVDSFRRLVALTPDAASSQVMLGGALFANGDRGGAMSALDVAAQLRPGSSAVKSSQIDLQFAFGNADTAVSMARAFQTSYPGPEADLLFADTLIKTKRFGEASDILTKSFASQPDQAVLTRLVGVKLSAGDKKGAASLMSQWLAKNPDDTAVRHDFAALSMSEKDLSTARSQYEAILKQNGNDVPALNNLGYLLQQSEPDRASSLLTRAVQLAPTSAEAADTLGWFKLQSKKDIPGSLALLQRAHDLKPQDAQITYHLVLALDASAKRDAARGLLKSLLASKARFEEQPDAQRLAAAWR